MPLYESNSINIYRYSSGENTSNYGKPENILTLQSSVMGDRQFLTANESVKAFGVVTQGSIEIYLDLDVDIQPNDIITVDDNPIRYKVFGDPEKLDTIMMQQVVTLKREGTIQPISE